MLREFRFRREFADFMPLFGGGMPNALAAYGAMHDVVDHAVHGFAFDASGEFAALGARVWRECCESFTAGEGLAQAAHVGQDTYGVLARAGHPFALPPATPPGHLFTTYDRAVVGAAVCASLEYMSHVQNAMDHARVGFLAARQYWAHERSIFPRRLHQAFEQGRALLELVPYGECEVTLSFDDAYPCAQVVFDVAHDHHEPLALGGEP